MKKLISLIMLAMTAISVARADVTLYAAASTTNAMSDIAAAIREQKGITVKTSFASSSTLAKQIAAGAPAALFVSANPKWMDYLEKKQLLAANSRSDLLKNEVVLVAPANSNITVRMHKDFDFAGAFEGKLCMGDPAHVPAGIYGKQALEHLGWWDAVQPRIASAGDVRAALGFVERGECPLGIVYATDAAITDKVKIVATFPTESHPPVIYPAALLKDRGTSAEAISVMDFLFSPAAAEIFARYGFRTVQH